MFSLSLCIHVPLPPGLPDCPCDEKGWIRQHHSRASFMGIRRKRSNDSKGSWFTKCMCVCTCVFIPWVSECVCACLFVVLVCYEYTHTYLCGCLFVSMFVVCVLSVMTVWVLSIHMCDCAYVGCSHTWRSIKSGFSPQSLWTLKRNDRGMHRSCINSE